MGRKDNFQNHTHPSASVSLSVNKAGNRLQQRSWNFSGCLRQSPLCLEWNPRSQKNLISASHFGNSLMWLILLNFLQTGKNTHSRIQPEGWDHLHEQGVIQGLETPNRTKEQRKQLTPSVKIKAGLLLTSRAPGCLQLQVELIPRRTLLVPILLLEIGAEKLLEPCHPPCSCKKERPSNPHTDTALLISCPGPLHSPILSAGERSQRWHGWGCWLWRRKRLQLLANERKFQD